MGILFAGLLFFAGIFYTQFPLSAQTAEPLGELSRETGMATHEALSAIDESAILLGEPVAQAVPANGSSILIVLRMVLVLALAALAIYGVVFFIKRVSRPQESRDPHLKILARTALSSDSYAAVVSVGRKAWLVAGGGGGVNLISELEESESLETMLLDEERKAAEAGNRPLIDFRSLISRFGSAPRQGRDANSGSENNSLSERLRKQRERLGGH